MAVEILQEVFVEQASIIAARENPRRKSSISAIALATGIRANAVSKRISAPPSEEIGLTCPEAAILADWADDPVFSDESTGKPAELRIYGKGKSFQTLVKRSTAGSIGYGIVLDQLLSSGNVVLVDDGKRVKLKSRFHIPAGAPDDNTLEILSRAYSHLGFTVVNNISNENADKRPAGYFQQELYSRRINVADHDKARESLNDMLVSQHGQAYDKIAALESKGKRSGPEIGVGYYYFEVKNYIEGCGSG